MKIYRIIDTGNNDYLSSLYHNGRGGMWTKDFKYCLLFVNKCVAEEYLKEVVKQCKGGNFKIIGDKIKLTGKTIL